MSPNPTPTGIEEAARKESTIDWVHRQFGTSKEELREPNVTVDHSCHAIPSQTYKDPGQKDTNIEVNSGKSLWSDEVDNIEAQIHTKITTGGKENKDNWKK